MLIPDTSMGAVVPTLPALAPLSQRPTPYQFSGLGQVDAGLADPTRMVWGILSTASMAVGAYHGYRRNNSVGWALWWGLMGALFPVITPTIAVAQGFGKKA